MSEQELYLLSFGVLGLLFVTMVTGFRADRKITKKFKQELEEKCLD